MSEGHRTVGELELLLDGHLKDCNRSAALVEKRLNRIEMWLVTALATMVVGLGAELYRVTITAHSAPAPVYVISAGHAPQLIEPAGGH